MSSPFEPHHGLCELVSELPSSSPSHSASSMTSRKPKKPPPITPKRFTRFFTPRSSVHGSSHSNSLGNSGRQLRDITRTAVNRPNGLHKTTPRKTVNFADIAADKQMRTPQVNSRKRKAPYLSPESSPVQSSPSKRSKFVTPQPITVLEDEPALEQPFVFPEAIRRLKSLGSTSRMLQRSFGGILGVGRGFHRDHCSSWEEQTSNFYSGPDDCHQLPQGAPPFSTAGCNSNSLVAIGDEDGWVHLLDASDDATSDFTRAHLSFRPHTNAVMDMQFSSDDAYLATGSGDQTAQIIDVRTQQCVSVLSKHRSSVKQVRFQPSEDKIVATSSRDGTVQIWDLRCKGGLDNIHQLWGVDAPYVGIIRTLTAAHADNSFVSPNGASTTTAKIPKELLGKSEALSRRNEISVTALSFLPTGREHLLLTASDASTCVKVWDIRARYSRRGPAIPISTTRQPESHNRHRHFAINSLTLSGDAARLYALSKDNTVYAYSTSHLILGVAPELSVSTSASHRYASIGKEGLGPMYGFRHRNFHAGSFYVKAALRKASGDQPELLAVGSTDGCPVVFPTDERFLRHEPSRDEGADELPQFPARPSLSRNSSSTSRFPNLLEDQIPIYEHGTPLVRGHDAEVGSVSFAKSGTLVSISDDFSVRRWKEGPQARELRSGGEADGRRWRSGWAIVSEGFDDDDK
ncbi:WD40 repeat-like protein [Lojkania enalia]|uniref:WD40 repeat-like protein n=1 Tax=Lojkania enalia TaxID=147567 RepID=A0A9P4JYZ2_9PLEO|nr:WD40 repeat-like protein [Didymosphaeria enalia]